jgi:4'-phosphopantetheinyl transferase EntD
LVSLANPWPEELTVIVAQKPDELTRLVIGPQALPRPGQLLFSIKEAAIKALSPILGRWIDFAELHASVDGNEFTVSIEGALGIIVAGWWDQVGDFLICVAALPRSIDQSS